MPTVNIVHAFKFTHNDGHIEDFKPGAYDLPQEVADHLYVRAHSDNPVKAAPPPGTREAMIAAKEREQRKQVLDAAAKQVAEDNGGTDADPEGEETPETAAVKAALKVTQRRKLKEA